MILNHQRGIRVSIRKLDEFAAAARNLLKLPDDAVTVCLVSNVEMARWNRAYRGKKGPTDVLSFPRDGAGLRTKRTNLRNKPRSSADSTEAASYLGDIAIAPGVARRNALRFGRTFDQEMRILILHGMLHLMGYDHETDSGQMDRRERKLRRALKLE
ncbi:MAG TPA: rRNA maturation RNase YbeY [Candidatus Acidoferrales bacterium]|jgi:probable rRNA maturation factor|nr:rRNA maturation RNase YbeY [Candidatus Acidoferrales bacterium]